MSKIRYTAILPKMVHIQHQFDTYEQAESWMKNTRSPGYIAIIVGEIRFNAEVKDVEQKIIEFAKTLQVKEPVA